MTKTGDWQTSGLSLLPRSKLVPTGHQGPAMLEAVTASRTATHHYFLERPLETLNIKEAVSNQRILSGLCYAHRDAAAVAVSRSYWHRSEMTLITAVTKKLSAASRNASSHLISLAQLGRSPELSRCNGIGIGGSAPASLLSVFWTP